jgi:hypothetical protein
MVPDLSMIIEPGNGSFSIGKDFLFDFIGKTNIRYLGSRSRVMTARHTEIIGCEALHNNQSLSPIWIVMKAAH